MNNRREIERFKECRHCHGLNTQEIGSSDDHWKITYVGWCRDCKDDYGYSVSVVTVWDRKNRI